MMASVDVLGNKRKRKANFSSREVWVLLEQIKQHGPVIFSKLTNNVTNHQKQQLWANISTVVTNVGHELRSSNECREKWQKIQCDVLARRKSRSKTGGEPVKAKEYDEFVMDILGEDTPRVAGLQGVYIKFHLREEAKQNL